jgi:putative transposase
MVEAIEVRFGMADHLPHRIQWLADNGVAYIVRETRDFEQIMVPDTYTTPPYSPELDAMSESSVKTAKRHYVHMDILTHEVTVIRLSP